MSQTIHPEMGPGVHERAISRTYRKPFVTRRPTRAPFPSSTVFVAIVVPCRTARTAPGRPGRVYRLEDPAHDAVGRLARRRHLGQHRRAAVEGHEQDVGERSADVDADEMGHARLTPAG